MAHLDEPISETEKIRVVSDFILHAPPGEFNEVFNDVRTILNDDRLLKEGASQAFTRYNKDQYTPCRIQGHPEPTLISEFGELEEGRFLDPRTHQSFAFDQLRKEASDYRPHPPHPIAEQWRAAFDQEITKYKNEHYKNGACAVYGAVDEKGDISLVLCIEAHQFAPQNFWNGRWRSRWTVTFSPGDEAELTGTLKAQVHYYEDGNVQLVSHKECLRSVHMKDPAEAARELTSLISEEENIYQNALAENYQTMSETTFKALRRQLPVTRTKFEWGKFMSYKIGSELKQA